MEGLVEAGKACILATIRGCVASPVCREECLTLGRFVAKLGLILTELELCMQGNEGLRGAPPSCAHLFSLPARLPADRSPGIRCG